MVTEDNSHGETGKRVLFADNACRGMETEKLFANNLSPCMRIGI